MRRVRCHGSSGQAPQLELRGTGKEYRRRHGGDPSAASAGEPMSPRERELEREVRKLREENEFLKKAAAFFAKDHR